MFYFSALMVQGTTSDAGKSTLVTGLGRVLQRRGVKVAPFKPQNMALNSAVTTDGGEIGRAQAVQAKACGVAPSVDMNPVLIKPASDTNAQVIIQGKALTSMDAQNYHHYKPIARQAVLNSYARLTGQYQTVLTEGAGSPAEINLREGDIANMGFAEAVDCPVILIADIDKGGVFAHIVGTLALLSETEQARVVGFVINRFRGDIALLKPGLDWLEEHTGKPVLGVLPYLHNFYLESEDAIDSAQCESTDSLNVVVPVLPRISNHTDFDALRLHPYVNLKFVDAAGAIPPCDLIILPGSKNVADDCEYLKQNDWANLLTRHLRYGGKVLGICGGFQMLGQSITDPHAVETQKQHTEGFGLLPVATELAAQKTLRHIKGKLSLAPRQAGFCGYEIHHGQTHLLDQAAQPMITRNDGSYDGCVSNDNNIAGCYTHGLFDQPEASNAILHWAGLEKKAAPDVALIQEQQINRLADTLEQHLDFAALERALKAFTTRKAHADTTTPS